MKTPFSSSNLSDTSRRRIDMAVAVAQERLLGAHVRHALDFVELVDDRVPFDDVLDIYARLLRLSPEQANIVRTRTLATLGQRSAHREEPEPREDETTQEAAADDEETDQRSLFSRLRQRLRGRIDEELRFLIELEAARAEEAALYTHVENALNFIELLDEDLSAPEAADLYLDALDVRESVSEVVYNLSLAQLSDRYLPGDRDDRKTELQIVLSDPRDGPGDADDAHGRALEASGD